jgi:hypothetical protein
MAPEASSGFSSQGVPRIHKGIPLAHLRGLGMQNYQLAARILPKTRGLLEGCLTLIRGELL